MRTGECDEFIFYAVEEARRYLHISEPVIKQKNKIIFYTQEEMESRYVEPEERLCRFCSFNLPTPKSHPFFLPKKLVIGLQWHSRHEEKPESLPAGVISYESIHVSYHPLNSTIYTYPLSAKTERCKPEFCIKFDLVDRIAIDAFWTDLIFNNFHSIVEIASKAHDARLNPHLNIKRVGLEEDVPVIMSSLLRFD